MYARCLFSVHRRLANFIILVGANSDWRLNQHCYSQLPPVPQGATVEYHCEKLSFGHIVSINKTSSDDVAKTYWILMLHEVQVHGYKSGMMVAIRI